MESKTELKQSKEEKKYLKYSAYPVQVIKQKNWAI